MSAPLAVPPAARDTAPVRLALVPWLLCSGCLQPVEAPDGGVTSGTWRSVLFPNDWTPAHTADGGAFLHDFSYAGFEGGREPVSVGLPEGLSCPEGDATAVLQRAFDEAPDGGLLTLGPGTWRIDGALRVTRSNLIVRGSPDTTLVFTKSAGLSFSQHVTIGGEPLVTGEAPLLLDARARSFTVDVGPIDGGVLAPGDDVVLGHVITPEFVAAHGMTGTWRAFNDTWQPIAWRTVTKVEGSRVTLDVPLRSDLLLRDRPTLRRVVHRVHHVGFENLRFTNVVDRASALAMDQVAVFHLTGVKDCWVRNLRSVSLDGGAHVQSVGVRVHQSKRVTVTDTFIGEAQHRGSGGNGYLFEVRQSNEVLFRDCEARGGRHNFIQNWGFGTSGCVWQRVRSTGGTLETPLGSGRGLSEFHHSLATANLIEDSVFDDGFAIVNRGAESTGAGHTGTENVFWNVRGAGVLRSMQFGRGYIIGTRGLTVETSDLLQLADRATASRSPRRPGRRRSTRSALTVRGPAPPPTSLTPKACARQPARVSSP
jgi:hypothetical protein